MKGIWIRLVCCGVMLLVPRPAFAWWEATLQQADIDIEMTPEGPARIRYDLRYHVDRGRFEGLNINDPGRTIQWDRLASYIEDARGQRYPIRFMRRHRDGAYLIRIARPPGLRRGWVTVHLEHVENFAECCLHTDTDGRARLDWNAFSWDVGMDRMTIAVRMLPAAEGLEADADTTMIFDVDVLPDGLLIDKIRPVRWYQPHLGLLLPAGWLQQEPPPLETDLGRPDIGTEEATFVAAPLRDLESGRGRGQASFFLALTALACLLLLAFKWWITGEGYPRTAGPAPALLLPHVPPLLRWAFLGAALLAGAWLQSASFLAAGSLAFAAGVLLSVRAPVRTVGERNLTHWWEGGPAELVALAGSPHRARRRVAHLTDGTSLPGFVLLLVAAAGSAFLAQRFHGAVPSHVLDSIAIDAVLTMTALMLTARRRDLPPTTTRGAAPLFEALIHCFTTTADKLGSRPVVFAGGSEPKGEAESFRVKLEPPPRGTNEVTVDVEQCTGLGGWFLRLVGTIKTDDGTTITLRSRSPRTLARRLSRQLLRSRRAASA